MNPPIDLNKVGKIFQQGDIPNKYPRDIRCIWGWLLRVSHPKGPPPFSLWNKIGYHFFGDFHDDQTVTFLSCQVERAKRELKATLVNGRGPMGAKQGMQKGAAPEETSQFEGNDMKK